MYRKGAQDRKRAQLFAKLGKEIMVAAKMGGNGDPDTNSRLRLAIQTAKTQSMPKDNIERAIDKSSVNLGSNFENLRYEGFGPDKVAVIVETLTDNKNRTASNIRTIFQKNGGKLGESGVAAHKFRQVGIIRINKDKISENEVLELATSGGAEDCSSEGFCHEIITLKENFYKVKIEIGKKINEFISSGIEWVPLNKVLLDQEKTKSVLNLLEILENDDDVQYVYANLEVHNGSSLKV